MANVDLEEFDRLVHEIIKNNRGMSKAWASAMGLSQGVFLNKANPNCDDTFFSPSQLGHLIVLSGDTRLIDAIERYTESSGGDVYDYHEATMRTDIERGEVAIVFIECDRDKVITPSEEAKVLKEIDDEAAALKVKRKAFKRYAKKSRGGGK